MPPRLFAALLACALSAPAFAACGTPPPAVVDIDANRYYSDAHHSVIDPVLRARNIAATKPVEDFLARVSADASSADSGRNACALAWLAGWADGGAMLGTMSTEQSYYQRKWTLAGLALSYARVKPAASAEQRAAIEGWLRRLADATMVHSDAKKGERNNHYYWEGLAVAAAGAATGEPRHLAWGRKVFDHAMAQVAADGSLPREMTRAAKALHYHAFAAAPLAMLASILDVHAEPLDRLVAFTVAAARDPSGIEKSTGFKQEPLNVTKEAWLVVYARHEGKVIEGAKAARYPRLGGDLAVPNPLEHVKNRGT